MKLERWALADFHSTQARRSRLNILPGELGSVGRVWSRGMQCYMSEEAEKHKNHQAGDGLAAADSGLPQCQVVKQNSTKPFFRIANRQNYNQRSPCAPQ